MTLSGFYAGRLGKLDAQVQEGHAGRLPSRADRDAGRTAEGQKRRVTMWAGRVPGLVPQAGPVTKS